jgi:predicted kinase
LKPFAIMMTGIPASGKSTLREAIASKLDQPVIVAPDDLIDSVADAVGKFYRDIYTTEAARTVCYDAALFRMDEAIRNQRNLILDRTYLTREQRARALSRFAKQPVYRFISVTMEHPTDLTEWVSRLDSRVGKEIPPKTLFAMIRSMESPGTDEGFEKLFVGSNGEAFQDAIVNYIRETSL